MEELKVDREDALAKQLLAFVAASRTRGRDPEAGHDALRALQTALRVVEAMPPTEGLS